MNYRRQYDNLIERASSRIIDGYVEVHHIIPKCMGGTDDKSNLVSLTAREHFIAHLLLSRIYPDNKKLIYAVHLMSNTRSGIKISNRIYESIRIKNSEIRKNEKKSLETKEKMSLAKLGIKRDDFTDEWKNNISNSLIGRTFSDEHKKNLSSSMRGKKRKPFSEEHRQKLSLAGKKRFAENKGINHA